MSNMSTDIRSIARLTADHVAAGISPGRSLATAAREIVGDERSASMGRWTINTSEMCWAFRVARRAHPKLEGPALRPYYRAALEAIEGIARESGSVLAREDGDAPWTPIAPASVESPLDRHDSRRWRLAGASAYRAAAGVSQ